MEIYLVGGAIRDRLLDLPVKEKDWVVVGATADDMLKKGYRQVGKDFPVFLHPETNEEYALARRERKVGRGYTGFDFDASPEVTLEQDLLRRDLTINAIAQHVNDVHLGPTHNLIDPYHGRQHLQQKILQHVSAAFIEDPVRILRVARFAARFAELGFAVADSTNDLMKAMVKSGEVDALVPERVWKELERALQEKIPAEFFNVLSRCDALSVLFPLVHENNIIALARAARLSADAEVRFAALFYDLPTHEIKDLAERYRVPSTYRELALLVAMRHLDYLNAYKLEASQWLEFLQAIDAFRREERFKKFLIACEAVASPRKLKKGEPAIETQKIWAVFAVAKQVEIKKLMETGASGSEIANLLNAQRIDLIKKYLTNKFL